MSNDAQAGRLCRRPDVTHQNPYGASKMLRRRKAARLQAAGIVFVLPPQARFEGQPGEQWTMFFRDPSGNPIEVKGFVSLERVYDS